MYLILSINYSIWYINIDNIYYLCFRKQLTELGLHGSLGRLAAYCAASRATGSGGAIAPTPSRSSAAATARAKTSTEDPARSSSHVLCIAHGKLFAQKFFFLYNHFFTSFKGWRSLYFFTCTLGIYNRLILHQARPINFIGPRYWSILTQSILVQIYLYVTFYFLTLTILHKKKTA